MTKPVIASEANQSSFAMARKSWIASSLSLLAMTVELVCGLRKEA
jgi:hypothetical protein